MRKILMLTLLASALLGACVKDESHTATQEQMLNRVITLPDNGKTGNPNVLLSMSIGHDSKDCTGCMMINGHIVHVNCMGNGNYCAIAAVVHLQQVGTDVTATTTDTFGLTSENFFLMPARSLNYTDEHNNRIFLNIPGQMVYRDATTQQFTFTGLSFTSSPLY